MDKMHSTSDLGAIAEDRATELLIERGYDIVERNYRSKAGELDIIARQLDCLVFVEVRSRASVEHGDAIETIDCRKQSQIARVAHHYLMERTPIFETCRFDVVAINGTRIDLYIDAFRLGLLR